MKHGLIVFFLNLSAIASATSYYVSPSGINSNSGTQSSPFKTITYGISKLKAGDVLYLRDGTYHESISINVNGNSENRIIISGYPGETAIIDGGYNLPGGSEYSFLVKVGGSYITLKDIIIMRSDGSLLSISGDYSNGVNIKGSGSYETGIVTSGNYNLLDGCSMTDNGNHYGKDGQTTWGSAIEISGYANIMQNCISHDNKGEGLKTGQASQNCIIQDCISYNNGSCQVYIVSAVGSIIRRNLFYCTPGATYGPSSGISIGDEYGEDPKDIQIYNNLCFGNWLNLNTETNISKADGWLIANNTFLNSQKTSGDISSGYNMGIYIRSSLVTFNNSFFQNNIICEEGSNQIPINTSLVRSHTGFTFSHNCWNKTPTASAQGSGDIIGDPLIFKTGSTAPGMLAGDYFRLLGTSPALNKGTVLSKVTDDFFKYLRDATPDMGAIAYDGTVTFIPVTGITVSGATGATTITTLNGTLQLSAVIVPLNATNKAVTWSLTNGTGQATISSSGLITAEKNGIVTAKATANDGSGVSGTLVITISNQTENVNNHNLSPIIVINSPSKSYSGFVNEIDASGSYDPNKDFLTYTWIAPNNIPVSSTSGSSIKYLAPIVNATQFVEFTLGITDGETTSYKIIPIEILPYKPELETAEISYIEASSFQVPYYPHNIIDGDIGTNWAAEGDNQWLILELRQSFNVQHVKLAFQLGQNREYYFDILGSKDKVNWEPLLEKSTSCAFSSDLQVFEFPPSKSVKEYNFIKLIGRGNLTDSWNYISELKIFGYPHRNSPEYEKHAVKIYPNPANDHVTFRIDEPALSPDIIQITDLSGTVIYTSELTLDSREFTIPINLNKGIYVVQLISEHLISFTQKLVVSK